MHAVAFACIEQILTELIGQHGSDLVRAVINIDADRRVRLIGIPRPAVKQATIGGIEKAL